MAGKEKKDESGRDVGLVASAARGMLIGVCLAFVLALILSACVLASKDPDRLIAWMAPASLLLGALISALAATRFDQAHRISAGIVGGALYVVALWLISLFFRGENTQSAAPLAMALWYGGCCAAAGLGGLLGRGTKPRVREGAHSPTAIARRQLRRK